MKTLFVTALLATLTLSGCYTTKDYESFVQTLYKGGGTIDRADARVVCVCDIPRTCNGIVRVKHKRAPSLEARINNFECEMNPSVPFEIFSKQCQASAQSSGLLTTLENRKVEIHLISAPGAYKYVRMTDNYNNTYFATREYSQSIYPVFTKLKFKYLVSSGLSVDKKGEIVLEDNGDAYGSRGWDWEPITRKYLALYEQRLQALTDEGILLLNKEIQKG